MFFILLVNKSSVHRLVDLVSKRHDLCKDKHVLQHQGEHQQSLRWAGAQITIHYIAHQAHDNDKLNSFDSNDNLQILKRSLASCSSCRRTAALSWRTARII